MTNPITAIRAHHAEILKQLKSIPRAVAAIEVDSVEVSRPTLERVVTFLEGDLKPHAEGEERFLYPAVDDLVKLYERATATMSLDHVFITEKIDAFKSQAERILKLGESRASREEIQGALDELLETAHHLDAVISIHLDKEERVLLPLAEQHLSDAEAQKVLHQMHGGHDQGHEEK